MSARVVVVEDHPAVLRGLVALLDEEPDIEVCGAAGCISDATALIADQRPDVAVIDLCLGPEDGLELVAALAPRISVVVLSLQDATAVKALSRAAGARAFVSKERAVEDLADAIRDLSPS